MLYNKLAADRTNISSLNLHFKCSSRDKYVATAGQTFAECILHSSHALGEAPQTHPIVHERSDPAVVSCVSFPHERSDAVPAENRVATFWRVCGFLKNIICSAFYNFSTIWWWAPSSGFGSWEVRRCLQFPLYLNFSSSLCSYTIGARLATFWHVWLQNKLLYAVFNFFGFAMRGQMLFPHGSSF